LIDTHLHLDDPKFDSDRTELLDRARQAGVSHFVTIGTHVDDSAWAASFAPTQADVSAAVGMHPELCGTWQEGMERRFEELALLPKVVAIGEVGLDYHSPGYDAPLQQRVFRSMLRLSLKLRLPLVIHQRDAAEDTLRLLAEEGAGTQGGVFHCFAGDADCATRAMQLGFDIAVGGILTYPSAGALREVIEAVPLGRLVLETDAPWLAPQDRRGKRNEPAFMRSVALRLAEMKKLSYDEVDAATTANAMRIFRIRT
jgi:TatD DNase family protein